MLCTDTQVWNPLDVFFQVLQFALLILGIVLWALHNSEGNGPRPTVKHSSTPEDPSAYRPISDQEKWDLRQTYRSLETDRLCVLWLEGGLKADAAAILKEELVRRGVDLAPENESKLSFSIWTR